MFLATCEMYLLDEFVKTSYETRPPKLCQTHIWQDTSITQNIRSNISLNKSDNTFRSKTISHTFCKIFWRKNKNSLGTYLPEIFLRNPLGWLVSWLVPKNIFGHYPTAILLEISPTNSPYRNFTYTRICSHQKIFAPKNFFTRRGFTPNSFYIRNLWYQRVFRPEIFSTTGTSHQRVYIYIYTYAYTRKLLQKNTTAMSTAGTFYTKGVLHHRESAPKSLYTQRLLRLRNCIKQFLRRATFTPEDVYTWIVYIQKILTPKPFLPTNLYNNICLHQPICTKYIAFDLKRHLQPRHFTPKSFYTKAFLHKTVFTPENHAMYTAKNLDCKA